MRFSADRRSVARRHPAAPHAADTDHPAYPYDDPAARDRSGTQWRFDAEAARAAAVAAALSHGAFDPGTRVRAGLSPRATAASVGARLARDPLVSSSARSQGTLLRGFHLRPESVQLLVRVYFDRKSPRLKSSH